MFSDADRRLAELAADHHAVFTLDDARECGLTHRQIDHRVARVWTKLHDGVFGVPGSPMTWEARLYAATAAAPTLAAVSHRSAAALLGLPGGRREPVEITCRRWKRTQKSGLVVHESTRLYPEDVTLVGAIPVMRPERVILQLAGTYPRPDFIETVVHAARRKRLITYESMFDVFARRARRGVPGVQVTRKVLERWDPSSRATESEMETRLLQTLRVHGLPEPVLQFEVYDEQGLFVARTDAGFPQWSITVDYDSTQEHSDEFQLARDAKRRNDIVAAGYKPLTARYADLVTGGRALVDQIRRTAGAMA